MDVSQSEMSEMSDDSNILFSYLERVSTPESSLHSVAIRGRPRRRPRRKKTETPVLTYETAREELRIAMTWRGNNPKPRWKAIRKAYKREANLNGFSIEDVTEIWTDVVTSPTVKINTLERAKLILAMIPRRKVPWILVQDMLNWLVRGLFEIKTLVATNILVYFIGLSEFDLIDEEGIQLWETFDYHLLVSLRDREVLLPHLCTLLQLVTRKFHITETVVEGWIEFRTRNLSGRGEGVVSGLLRHYKSMCSKTFQIIERNVKITGTTPFVRMKPSFMTSMYNAQGRATGRSRTDEIPALLTGGPLSMDVFFPEFKPDVETINSNSSFDLKEEKARMYHCLLNEEYLLMLIKDTGLLEKFSLRVSLIFKTKFNNYDMTQGHRYRFLLDRCHLLARFLNYHGETLHVLDDWLPDFLIDWDGHLFRTEIYQLIPYIGLLDFEDGYMCVLDKLERQFNDGDLNERIEIWKLLEKLYLLWSKMIPTDDNQGNDASSIRSPTEIVNTLYSFMCRLINEYAASTGVGVILFHSILCDSFEKMILQYEAQVDLEPPFPPIVFLYLVLQAGSLSLLTTYCRLMRRFRDRVREIIVCPERRSVIFQTTVKPVRTLNRFFSNHSSLRSLFRTEINVRKNSVYEDDDTCSKHLRMKLKNVENFNLRNCNYAQEYRDGEWSYDMEEWMPEPELPDEHEHGVE